KVDLQVRTGEIVAITGIEGNGQRELAEAVFGLRRVAEGSIEMQGVDITRSSVRHRLELGMSYVPEDCVNDGISASLSVMENVVAGRHRSPELSRHGLLRRGA